MQRRAAAAYVAFFVIIAAGSYAFIGVAEEPTITVDDPDITASAGDTFTVDGVEYTVEDVAEPAPANEEGVEAGEPADEPQIPVEATITWMEDVTQTESLAVGDEFMLDDMNWSVEVPDEEDPTTFQLIEIVEIDRPTVEDDGVTYVIVERDGEQVLVERDDYVREEFGEPAEREFSEGDTFNETQTVEEVTADEVTITQIEAEEQSVVLGEGDEETFGETTYVSHFPDRSTLALTSDLDAYEQELTEQQTFHDRITGISYVGIFALLFAFVMVPLAYLPKRR